MVSPTQGPSAFSREVRRQSGPKASVSTMQRPDRRAGEKLDVERAGVEPGHAEQPVRGVNVINVINVSHQRHQRELNNQYAGSTWST
jgi:hypothetical protein